MTTQKHDQTEDAAFEEFLGGRGELVKQLKKLAQLSPSAALDAAVLASAKAAVAQAERSKLTAANDAVVPSMPGKPGFLSNFRMPMGLAASLMVAVLVSVLWHQSADLTAEFTQAPEAAPAAAEMAAAPPAVTAAAALADTAKAKNPAQASQPAATAAAPAQAAPAAPAPVAAVKPPVTVAPAPVAAAVKPAVTKDALVVPPAPAVAVAKPAAPVAEAKSVVSEKKVEMSSIAAGVANDASKRSAERGEPAAVGTATGTTTVAPAIAGNLATAATNQPAAPAAPASAATPAPATVEPAKPEAPLTAVEKAKAWLAAIEEMSKYESRKEAALIQLERFEKSYPHFPVPEALRAKLKK